MEVLLFINNNDLGSINDEWYYCLSIRVTWGLLMTNEAIVYQ